MQIFEVKIPGEGKNVSQIHAKKNKFLTLEKKNGALLNLAIIFTFSPILTCEPFHQ